VVDTGRLLRRKAPRLNISVSAPRNDWVLFIWAVVLHYILSFLPIQSCHPECVPALHGRNYKTRGISNYDSKPNAYFEILLLVKEMSDEVVSGFTGYEQNGFLVADYYLNLGTIYPPLDPRPNGETLQ